MSDLWNVKHCVDRINNKTHAERQLIEFTFSNSHGLRFTLLSCLLCVPMSVIAVFNVLYLALAVQYWWNVERERDAVARNYLV